MSKISRAMKVLKKELSKDRAPADSYYHAWQSNIAMSIKDEIPELTHEQVNSAAERFLHLLIR